MTPHDFRAELGRLGLSDREAARFFDVDPRNVRRWGQEEGDGPPRSVALTLRLMARFAVSAEDAARLLVGS